MRRIALFLLASLGCPKKVCEPGQERPCLRCGTYAGQGSFAEYGAQKCIEAGRRFGPCAPPTPVQALVKAARRGELAQVQRLLDQGANINGRIKGCTTPLIAAAEAGRDHVVSALLARGADPLAHLELEAFGKTALYRAAVANHVHVVQVMLAGKTPPDRGTMDGRAPLHAAAERGLMQLARTLLDGGASVNVVDESTGERPLHLAAVQGHLQMAKLLIERSAQLEVRDKLGQTPLHKAARRCHAELVEMLVEAQAEPNVLDSEGRTPLDRALSRPPPDRALSRPPSDRALSPDRPNGPCAPAEVAKMRAAGLKARSAP